MMGSRGHSLLGGQIVGLDGIAKWSLCFASACFISVAELLGYNYIASTVRMRESSPDSLLSNIIY